MRTAITEMRCRYHRAERDTDRSLGIRQKIGNPSQGLVLLCVTHMQDGPHQERVAGPFPVVTLFVRAFRIDQDVRDILDIANLPLTPTDLEQGIVGRRAAVGRIKQQHVSVAGAETRSQIPVLALDIVNDATARPSQKRWYHKANTLARPRRRETEHVFWSIVPEIRTFEAAKYNTIRIHKTHGADFGR